MGSYLSYLPKPITDKVSIEEFNEKIKCGASSMQGWRITQEDAHNCLLDFDKNTCLFAVYDGHGGHEVAVYCSMKFPDFLKTSESYKNGDYVKALEEAFLGFDATIATPEVVSVLKKLVTVKEDDSDEDDVEENVNNLYEEASMPIEKVIERYITKDNEKFSANTINTVSSSSSSSASGGGSSGSSGLVKTKKKVEKENCGKADSSADKNSAPINSHQNGQVDDSNVSSSSASACINGDLTRKGKGKALAKTKGAMPSSNNDRPKRSVQQIYEKLLDFEEDSDDSEDEEDKTFEGPNVDSCSDDNDDDEGVGPLANLEDDDSSEDTDDDDDDDDESDDESDDDEDDNKSKFSRNIRQGEEPGSDSGCTAVVALLKDDNLYVANAGDSRCIVCRSGKAVEMSIDHKPEDETEKQRVLKAGGNVTADGRINGCLNLSRAIGDHFYKQNKELSDKEQMITALPDVRTLTINPREDEFMVLACDGIWNFMSSQEVIDFVRPALQEGKSISKICEEMFDHCLAPNTMGDGTGCDNMTAIIVQLKPINCQKRSVESEESEERENKKTKTENTTPNAV